jgi:hypothetical protein
MTDVFKSFTRTIRKLLLRYDKDLASAFIDSNIEEIWQDHDKWNGGIDTYLIKLNLPLNVYYKFKDSNRIEEAEKKVASFYEDVLKGDNSLCLSGVAISPNVDSQSSFGINSNDSMWKPGYFRLFISHVTKYKKSASNLKRSLANYGIDCFVAHEDITPSKEWEEEIENGLFTMDALCAIVVPEFIESKWCYQEVGIALGQHKLVISISKGENPYGFFGKFQALKNLTSASEMANDVWKAITINDSTKDLYSEKLINLLLNVKSSSECMNLLQVIESYESIDRRYIIFLHNHFTDNPVLMKGKNLEIANALFEKFGLERITVEQSRNVQNVIDDSLPF